MSVSFCFLLRENQVIIFLRAEKNMGEEKKTNKDANQVDEKRNRRASVFLPINPLKNNTSRFDLSQRVEDRIVTPLYCH